MTRDDPDATAAFPRPPSRLRVWTRRLVVCGLLLALVGVGGLAGAYWYFIVQMEAPHLTRDAIQEVIAQESPVYYADGTTKLGVFFSEEHRQYVPAKDLPEDFVHALVSAEDRTFYEHFGFSPKGISRAMLQNLRAGRTVAGGSTLTQQTAKNLFERRGRTYSEKLRELANALRLERTYTKHEILEFYSNQFYVNGNGRGLAIAARFFFDKDVSELELLESAFLAGVVKSPNRYNPFVPDEARRARNLARSEERVEYVLGRMLEDGWIDQETHDREVARDIPFRRGRFRFERSVVLDYVEQELNSPEFRATLLAHGVDDPGRAGLQIVTTLDPEVQNQTVYALRHHLSDVGLWLEAPELGTLFGEPRSLPPLRLDDLAPRSFHTGLLQSVDVDGQSAVVDFGHDLTGLLDQDAHQRLATALLRGAKKNTWVEAKRADRKALLAELEAFVGRSLLVSVRSVKEDGTPVLDYEPDVELEGATVVLQDGEVRAMVGGWKNTDFNRATSARRQLGSTWKLVLFEAALQLGWSPTDALDNRRAVFPYQTTFYYPRPDHTGAPDTVSMGWAAARSENLATIWLLDHLSDPLTEPQFRALAARVGLVPSKAEDRKAWIRRVQDAGVLPTRGRLTDGLFREVWRDEIAPDLLFAGREDDIRIGTSMHYGLGFDDERQVVAADRSLGPKERAARFAALDRSFLAQEALARRFEQARERILEAEDGGEGIPDALLAGFFVRQTEEGAPSLVFADAAPEGFTPLTAKALAGLVGPRVEENPWDDVELAPRKGPRRTRYAPEPVSGGDGPSDAEPGEPDPAEPEPAEPEQGEAGSEGEGSAASGGARRRHLDRILAGGVVAPPPSVSELLDPDTVRLAGMLTPSLVARTRTALDEAVAGFGEDVDLYDFDTIAHVRDFRLLVHLEYLRMLVRRSGVRSEVMPVMSMPLGSSDITLLEAGLLYQAMITGRTHRFYADALSSAPVETASLEDGPRRRRDDVSVVREVRLANGTVIYSTARETNPLHGPGVSAELQGMLRAVVTHGTGRRAAGGAPLTSSDAKRAAELKRRAAVVPLFGKTGTTNSYKNSAFVGFVPDLGDADDGATHLSWGQGQVVATYVGYDDNREMRNGAVRLAGASGSLPAWLGAAHAVAAASDVGDRVDLVELDFAGGGTLPVAWPKEIELVKVDASTGLPLEDEGEGTAPTLVRRAAGGAFEPIAPGVE